MKHATQQLRKLVTRVLTGTYNREQVEKALAAANGEAQNSMGHRTPGGGWCINPPEVENAYAALNAANFGEWERALWLANTACAQKTEETLRRYMFQNQRRPGIGGEPEDRWIATTPRFIRLRTLIHGYESRKKALKKLALEKETRRG